MVAADRVVEASGEIGKRACNASDAVQSSTRQATGLEFAAQHRTCFIGESRMEVELAGSEMRVRLTLPLRRNVTRGNDASPNVCARFGRCCVEEVERRCRSNRHAYVESIEQRARQPPQVPLTGGVGAHARTRCTATTWTRIGCPDEKKSCRHHRTDSGACDTDVAVLERLT
jgi:hypothetical protein